MSYSSKTCSFLLSRTYKSVFNLANQLEKGIDSEILYYFDTRIHQSGIVGATKKFDE